MSKPDVTLPPDTSPEDRAAAWERAVGDFRRNMLSERLDAATRRHDARKSPAVLSSLLARIRLAGLCGR